MVHSQQSYFNHDGLAIYKIGEGESVLLMPYPHASGGASMSESRFVEILNEQGFSVLTFDPPGIYKSTRIADVSLNEMLDCAFEVLDYFNIADSITLFGHSQSGFCSIAFAVEHPERVKKLVLVGSVSGWPAVKRSSIHKAIPKGKDRRTLMRLGTRKMLGLSNLYVHNRLENIVSYYSYVDKSYMKQISLNKADKRQPEPLRAKWMAHLRKYNYDYSHRLNEIKVPTLILAGEHDVQTPIDVNTELHRGIVNSEMILFENSGHFPHVEERDKFISNVQLYLKN